MIAPIVSLAQMKINQWKSQEELESIQERKLNGLVSYASKHVPHYKNLKGTHVRCLEDLSGLPLITKQDIRFNTDSFISDRYGKGSLVRVSTSGSSGTPLEIFHHSSEASHGVACEIHQLTEDGVRPFDAVAHINYRSVPQRLPQRLGIFKRHYVSLYANETDKLAALRKIWPRALICNPSALLPLAQTNLASRNPLKIGKIFSYSELLSEKGRQLLMRSFDCKIYDLYGVVETSWVAWQCEDGNMHLHSDSLIAEIVDDKGRPLKKGQYGNLVITTLWKRSMPMIRYSVGDRTAFVSKCRCGRGLHTLKPIEGRNDDFIVLPSGRLISPRVVDVAMRSLPDVLLFQAIQEEAGQLHIKIVPVGRQPPDQAKQNFLNTLKNSLSEPMKITLEFVDSLPQGRTGKIQSVISKIDTGLDL